MLLKIEGYDDALLGIVNNNGEQVYMYDYDLLKQMVRKMLGCIWKKMFWTYSWVTVVQDS